MPDDNDPKTDSFATDPTPFTEASSESSQDADSEESAPPKKSAGGLKFLTFLMLILAVGLFAFPFIWGLEDKKAITPDASVLNDWLQWLGDMHLVVLHIPIGIFVYVFTMEIFGLLSFRKFKPRLSGALFLNSLFAVVAVAFGYFYFLGGDQSAELRWDLEDNKMGMHMWLSIVFAFFVILSFVAKIWAVHREKWSPFYPFFLLLAAASMTIGAHMGGQLVHPSKDIEGDFVKLINGEPLSIDADEVETVADVTDIPAKERLVYAEVVKPILQGKCWECHATADLNPLGKKKIKGELEMTSVAKLLAGGKGGKKLPTLVPGSSADSEMMVRVNLDTDEEDFMPTDKEDEPEMHLTDGEKRILAWWIDSSPLIDEEGDKPLSEVAGHEKILADVEAFQPVQVAVVASEEVVVKEAAKTEEKTEKVEKVDKAAPAPPKSEEKKEKAKVPTLKPTVPPVKSKPIQIPQSSSDPKKVGAKVAPPATEPKKVEAPKVVPAPAPKKVEAPKVAPAPAPKKVEAPKVAPAPEPKKVEAPKVAPKPEPKKVEAPKVVPAPEPKKVEAPKVAPAPEPKKVESPKMAPKPEPKKVEAPKVAPAPAPKKVEAPKVAPKPEPKKEEAPKKVDAPTPETKTEEVVPEKGDEVPAVLTPEERAREAIRKLREAAKAGA